MNVDPEDEELADLHVDLSPRESDLASHGDLSRDVFAGFDGVVNEFFEKGRLVLTELLIFRYGIGERGLYLHTLCQCMRNRQLGHVITFFS